MEKWVKGILIKILEINEFPKYLLELLRMGAQMEVHLQIRVTGHRAEDTLNPHTAHVTRSYVVPKILDIMKDFNASRTTKHF